MTAVDLTQLPDDPAEERAILVELSGAPTPVAAPSRRWLLALAAAASIVCMGFAGQVIAPSADTASVDTAAPSAMSSAPATDTSVPPADDGKQPAIALVVDPPSVRLIDGLVPVSLTAAPGAAVHVSVEVGDAVLGWRDVIVGRDGHWTGSIEVFAPRVRLLATVDATTFVADSAVGASATVVLDSSAQVTLWESAVSWPSATRAVVTFRASAPLSVRHARVWVANLMGRRLGSVMVAPSVDPWQPGSVGGRELGLGSVSGRVVVRHPPAGSMVLHVSWVDPATGGTSELERIFGPAVDFGTRPASARP